MTRIALCMAALVLLAPGPAASQGRAEEAIELSQRALGRSLPDVTLHSSDGRAVRLSDYRGKPLLVALVYTSCADVCPTLVESLAPAVRAAQKALGPDSFAVITVGFDVRNDTPERLASFARTRGVELPNWSFLAADQDGLDRLARALGFGIYARPGGFDHLAQVSIIDREGRLYQQVYGAVFEPPLIVEPLKALVFNREQPLASLAVLIDRIKYFCTVYDPASGRYYFNYSLFMGIAIGLGCFGLVLGLVVREWRRSARTARPTQ